VTLLGIFALGLGSIIAVGALIVGVYDALAGREEREW